MEPTDATANSTPVSDPSPIPATRSITDPTSTPKPTSDSTSTPEPTPKPNPDPACPTDPTPHRASNPTPPDSPLTDPKATPTPNPAPVDPNVVPTSAPKSISEAPSTTSSSSSSAQSTPKTSTRTPACTPIPATPPPATPSSTTTHPPLASTPSFKSSLQVLLKRQDVELEKNRVYEKEEKVERLRKENNSEGVKEEKNKDETKKRSEYRSNEEVVTKEEDEEEKEKATHKNAKERGEEVGKGKTWKNGREDTTEDSNKGEERNDKIKKEEITPKKERSMKSVTNKNYGKDTRENEKTPKVGGKEGKKITKGSSSRKKGGREEGKKIDEENEKNKENSSNKTQDRQNKSRNKKEEYQIKERPGKDTKEKEKREKTSENKVEINGSSVLEKKIETVKDKEKDGRRTMKEKREEELERTTTKGEKSQGILYIRKGERPFGWWKQYYCVLDGKLLTYYRSQTDYQRLSRLKGTLDLAMLEHIKVKKPGLLRTHFPFKLSRRNLPSVCLAAETWDERERWMEVMGELLQRLLHFTSHSADSTPRTALSVDHFKSATLPHRSAHKAPSSTTSEDECELKVKEKDGDNEENQQKGEKEPQIIAPKQVSKLSIGVPLLAVDLKQVTLKKVERTRKREDLHEAKYEKSTTLPHRSTHKAPSSTTSEDECELEVKEKDENKEEEQQQNEEEPRLITPKKISMVPIGVPLVAVNFKQVNLKKVETRRIMDELQEAEEKGNNKQSDMSSRGKADSGEKRGANEETTPSGKNMFGVKLKKIHSDDALGVRKKGSEGMKEVCEGLGEGTERRNENIEDTTPTTVKRMIKQPVIPLNTSGLLSRPEIVSPKVSPTTQKRSTTDRKKSPSPTIPISRSVQALTKLVDVKPTSIDVLSNADSTENVPTASNEISVNHIKISQIKYSNVVSLDVDQETVVPLSDVEEVGLAKVCEGMMPQEVTSSIESKSQKVYLKDEHKYEELNDDFQIMGKESSLKPHSSPALTPSIDRANTPSSYTSLDFPIPPIIKSPSPAPPSSATLNDSDSNNDEQYDEDFLHSVKVAHDAAITQGKAVAASQYNEQHEGVLSPPPSPVRERCNTNESSSSSQRCDADGTEKKSGKFKLFKLKKSNSNVGKDKTENSEGKELKERKRSGSNAFSKLLQGKKSKDKARKHSEDEDISASERATGSNTQFQEHGFPSLPPAELPAPEPTKTIAIEEPARETMQNKTEPITTTSMQTENKVFKGSHELLPDYSSEYIVIRRERSHSTDGLRGSNYSYGSTSSRDQEPAPSIPEKTRTRAKSPIHDIPQSNRPVTNLFHLSPDQEDLEDCMKPVDGYITGKQIEDILSATEIIEKRRLSQGRLQVPLVTVAGKAAGSDQLGSEDSSSRRPSFISLTSTDSDDPLPKTNFLGCDRHSFNSGSLKAREFDISAYDEYEAFAPPLLRKSRPTDSLSVGNRLSLTLPKFTVLEEDMVGSPDTAKTTFSGDDKTDEVKDHPDKGKENYNEKIGYEDMYMKEEEVKLQKESDNENVYDFKRKKSYENEQEVTEGNEPLGQDEQEKVSVKGEKLMQDEESENQEKTAITKEEDDEGDYFPIIGGKEGAKVDGPPFGSQPHPDTPMRTSGIAGLRKYLEEEQGETRQVKSGISRLGHSAAVEKLKQTSGEL